MYNKIDARSTSCKTTDFFFSKQLVEDLAELVLI